MPLLQLPLLKRTTCPHCWTAFPPEDILWVSSHQDLLNDARLGPYEQQRFLPTRFTIDGNALDGRGFVSTHLGCPKCHLLVPRALLEMEPLFVSILGTPASGKSFFLAAMTWELRRILPQVFGLSFTDTDTTFNLQLTHYEESLFLSPKAEQMQFLGGLILKTDDVLQNDKLYDLVNFGDQQVSYPRPFLFSLQPIEAHPNYVRSAEVSRILCLYDNAGEHFLAGQDKTHGPVTRHLAQSRFLMYLYDPTQDQRFRKACQERGVNLPVLEYSKPLPRQEVVLHEAAARVRRYCNLSQNTKHDRPLLVVVTKADAWISLLEDGGDFTDPWKPFGAFSSFNTEQVEKRSQALRTLLLKVCPEIVTAAESFAQTVVYIPVSALGVRPREIPDPQDPTKLRQAMRTRDIKPLWVTAPMLYGVSKYLPGLVQVLRRKSGTNSTAPMARVGTPG